MLDIIILSLILRTSPKPLEVANNSYEVITVKKASAGRAKAEKEREEAEKKKQTIIEEELIPEASTPKEEPLWEEKRIDPVTVYPTTLINIRSLPTIDSKLVGKATIDDAYTAIAEVYSYKGDECFYYRLSDGSFISRKYVKFTKTEKVEIPVVEPQVPTAPANIDYYTCGNTVSLPAGNYNIDTNYIGLKVVWTNQALLGTTSDRFTADTKQAVMNLQQNNNLPVTGVVDLTTWLLMGYSEDDWNTLGTYVTPLKVSAGASHEECAEKMMETAYEYMNAGTDYRVGCSGRPGTYVDCSGLIFQCLYSIGVTPGVNIVDHALAVKEYTSRDLCADERLGKQVAYEDMQVGDLVFYTRNGKTVSHVALYAGNGKMLDSDIGGVQIRDMRERSAIVKIVRVCP